MKVQVSLRGMHCAGCVLAIEEAARGVPGLSQASVNFAGENALLEIDPAVFRAPALQQALRDHGYRALPRRRSWRVSGLDPSGVAGLEDRLRSLPGVAAATANYALSTVAADLLFDADVEGLLRAQGLDPRPEEVAERDTELRDLSIRAAAAILLATVVMTLSMLHLGPPWLWLALTLPVQFWAGLPFHAGFLASLRHLRADMNALISIGTNAAFFAGFFMQGHPYYDTASTIIAVVLLGRLIELRARRGTRRAVEGLLELAPRSDVKPGDERLVKPGERFPADGAVIEGAGAVDESMLTGESLPVEKQPGSRVIGGTLNRMGALTVRFDRTGDDTVLAQIVRVMREAQGSKPSLQRLADLWAGRFVPLVLLISAATLAFWLSVEPSFALPAAVAVLIVACPCAFGLATPAAIMVAASRAARKGILFKDAGSLEAVGLLQRIVFDKTGTLTQGVPAVTGVVAAPGFSKDEVLRLAAAVERSSEHPLARAIVAAAPEGPRAEGFDARPGLGAVATLEGREIAVGNRPFFVILDVNFAPIQHALTSSVMNGETVVLVASGGTLAGLISIADPPRPESAAVVADLRGLGMRVSMLTGDDATTAGAMANRVGIDVSDVKAEVMPPDKASMIRDCQKAGPTGMVGDGINDAPALAVAEVGIAVCRGTDVAIEAADVVLMRNDLALVPAAVRLGRATRRAIHQNFAWAFGYNAILIPLAAGALHPWGMSLDPMLAAAAMALSSLAVVLNSLRLSRA